MPEGTGRDPHRTAQRHRLRRRRHGDAVPPVAAGELVADLVAPQRAKVQVYVRSVGAELVHEALEEEAVGEGLRPGQPQTVGDERVGRAPPARHGHAPLPCYLRCLAGEEEVWGEAELLYAPELALEPGAHPAFDVPVPL